MRTGSSWAVISDSIGITKENNTYKHFINQAADEVGTVFGVTPNIVNFGIGGLTTSQIAGNIWRYGHIDNKFDIIFVSAGANDAINLGAGNAVSLINTKANWQSIYSHLKSSNPDAKIIFLSWYPAAIINPPRPDISDYGTALYDFCNGVNTDGDTILRCDLWDAWENTEGDTTANLYEELFGGNPMYVHANAVGSVKLRDILLTFITARCADKLAKIHV